MTEKRNEKEFVDFVVSVNRVTKVTKGGKRFSFSAFVVSGKSEGSGSREGRIGVGLGKSKDVSSAIAKATARAHKNMIAVPLYQTTIPYNVEGRHGASKVVLHSACKGTGVIAGGPVRAVMTALGIQDILTKSMGSKASKQNVVKATLNALAKLRSIKDIARLRGKTTQEIIKGSHGAIG